MLRKHEGINDVIKLGRFKVIFENITKDSCMNYVVKHSLAIKAI